MKRVLLANNSKTIQKVVSLCLNNENYTLDIKESADETINAINNHLPDVVITDTMIPGKDGYSLCSLIKSNPKYKNLPVVIMHGTFEKFDESRYKNSNANAKICKPFNSQSLLKILNELTSKSTDNEPWEINALEDLNKVIQDEDDLQQQTQPETNKQKLKFNTNEVTQPSITLPDFDDSDILYDDDLLSENKEEMSKNIPIPSTGNKIPPPDMLSPQLKTSYSNENNIDIPIYELDSNDLQKVEDDELKKQIINIFQSECKATIEKIAMDIVPQIAEKIIKKEISIYLDSKK